VKKRLLVVMGLFVTFAGVLRAAGGDELAGESETARTLKKRVLSAPEETGPMSLTRSAAAIKSTFQIMPFVVMGGGEAKVLTQRGGLTLGTESSGGVKSESEEKNAEGSRQTLTQEHYEARPGYGLLSGSYGLPSSWAGTLIGGRQVGDWDFLVQANGRGRQGQSVYPLSTADPQLAAGQRLGAEGQAGWQVADDHRLSLDMDWDQRSQSLLAPLAGGSLTRRQAGGTLAWKANFADLFRQTVEVRGRDTHADASLGGGVSGGFEESLAGLKANWERDFQELPGHSGIAVGAEGTWASTGVSNHWEAPVFYSGDASLRFGLWPGSSFSGGILGQGLSSGFDSESFLFPEASWNQRLTGNVSLFALYDPGLSASWFAPNFYDKDLVVPSQTLLPERDSQRAHAGLRLSIGESSLEAEGFFVQSDQTWVLDDVGGASPAGVLQAVNAGSAQRWGAELQQEFAFSRDVSETLHYRWQRGALAQGGNLTYFPQHDANVGLKASRGIWGGQASVHYLSHRWVRMNGVEQTDPFASLDVRLECRLTEGFTIFGEGLNLLGQDVQEWAGYAEARPYVGLGATLKY
jgi:hypothetical protein